MPIDLSADVYHFYIGGCWLCWCTHQNQCPMTNIFRRYGYLSALHYDLNLWPGRSMSHFVVLGWLCVCPYIKINALYYSQYFLKVLLFNCICTMTLTHGRLCGCTFQNQHPMTNTLGAIEKLNAVAVLPWPLTFTVKVRFIMLIL